MSGGGGRGKVFSVQCSVFSVQCSEETEAEAEAGAEAEAEGSVFAKNRFWRQGRGGTLWAQRKRMILFLTYHKVLRGVESTPEFYTVRAEQLQRHLEMLGQSGLRPLALRELLGDGGVHPSAGAAGFD